LVCGLLHNIVSVSTLYSAEWLVGKDLEGGTE
jgi:hypothetical protein